jgi:phospholipid transport system transporter-binding protein
MLTLGPSLTNRNAAQVLRDGLVRLAQGEVQVDCSGLTQIDSAAVAVLLAWQREAVRHQRTLEVRNPPQQLTSLAHVYGVDSLLKLTAASPGAASHRH